MSYLVANTIEAKIHNEEYGMALMMLIEEYERRFTRIESKLSELTISINAIKGFINKNTSEPTDEYCNISGAKLGKSSVG